MAGPTINNMVLPKRRILVIEDEAKATTGTIFRHSEAGGARFHDMENGSEEPDPNTHILFVKEMSTEVIVDGVECLAMHENAVVGIIP